MNKTYKTPTIAVRDLNNAIKTALNYFKPPEKLTVDEWADKYRVLSPESSAEPGPWRTDRTPYLREPMRAFTDSKVNDITIVAASQVGKTEIELNVIGYIIDQMPGSILYIMPNLKVATKFSRQRIAPMVRDCKQLRKKVHTNKSKDGSNTILQKSFPGGILTICGSESATDLASTPTRYILGDERDRWAISAGEEGDPWKLAQARQITFYNRKSVEVSTPTIKGASNIEASFLQGTQERWCHKCPHCGEFTNITFDHIRFNYNSVLIKGKESFDVDVIGFACPHCGAITPEKEIRQQEAKWIAENPDAYKQGHRSFWLNAFSSPWMAWVDIIEQFLKNRKDPEKLKVVFNTLLGELWEDRGDLADEDEMLSRRELYEAELPDGVLALTCGVDVQDNRLEYEVVGFGMFGESWGIKKGYIMGRPDSADVWTRLDDVINHVYKFKNSDKGLKIVVTCVDSGGHFTQDVYEQCRLRFNRNVFPVKGKGGEGIPYVGKPNKVYIKGDKRYSVWLYSIGVDAGKSIIMDNLRVQEAGAKYCHFPINEERNYDINYFNGLLSEKLTLVKGKKGNRWAWEKLPGHRANEALDCRNYALAAFRIWDPDMEALSKRLLMNTNKNIKTQTKPRKRTNRYIDGDDW